MYLITSYTTDTSDLDLIPAVIIASDADRCKAIEKAKCDLKNDIVDSHTAKVFLPDAGDPVELDGSEKTFKKVIKMLKDNECNCVSIHRIAGGLEYDNVFTVNII